MKGAFSRVYLFILIILKKLYPSGVYYVNGPESLPPPLTAEQEEDAFALMRVNFQKAREMLIVHNLRLVVYIARKFENASTSIEDLISIGTIGLIKAVNTFCPERNIKLATYASRCIENEILMYLRKNNQRTEVSLDEPLNIDWDGNELLLSDVLGTDPDTINMHIEQEVDRTVILSAVSKLSAREKRIMEMRFGLNGCKEHTQKEVAALIGISQSYISRLEKKIINRLKKDIENLI